MNTIPDIQVRNRHAKDKRPICQVSLTVHRQMVREFVKELNDSAKQSGRADSAEHTAVEQVEATACEIGREAVQLPRRAIQHPASRESTDFSTDAQPKQSDQPRHAPEPLRQRTDAPRTRPKAKPPQSAAMPALQEQTRHTYAKRANKSRAEKPSARDHLHTEQSEIRFVDDLPECESLSIHEKPDIPEIRGQVQSEAASAKPFAVRHVKQSDAWTPQSTTAPAMRGKPAPPVQPPEPVQTPPAERLPAIREKPSQNLRLSRRLE